MTQYKATFSLPEIDIILLDKIAKARNCFVSAIIQDALLLWFRKHITEDFKIPCKKQMPVKGRRL